MRTRVAAILLSALILPGASAFAQSQTDKGQKDNLTIEHRAPNDSMIELRAAVRDLRQASVILLNEKKPGQKRQQAFKAAQDAIAKAQTAMMNLPVSMQTATKHDAKDWPAVAARLDRAAAALEDAVDNLSSKSSGNQKQAMQSAQAALSEVKNAVHDLPNWQVGANDK